MSDGGKGSVPRPIEVPRDEFNRRWEETFGKKQPECCGNPFKCKGNCIDMEKQNENSTLP